MVVYTIQRRTNYNALSLRGVLQSAADFSITMIAGGNHTLIKEADVAISWYHSSTCCAVTNIVPGDSQEVNCPEGAREATLGCGPNGPRNDTVVVSWAHHDAPAGDS